jgi:hypothetical protein
LPTICIDESGNFEKNTKTLLIGGLVYHGDDYEEERNRIEEFLKYECQELGIDYPKGIHAKDRRHRSDHVQQKSQLKSKIKDYLRTSGKYQFLMMIKPHNYQSKSSSNILDDEVASNLYENMIIQLLITYLFHNPDKENNTKIHLEIAKRSVPVKITDFETIEEYEALGYESKDLNYKGEKLYYLTSQSTFKSMLALAMEELGQNTDDHFAFHVESINYHSSKKDEDRPTTPFLYLADFACDIIRDSVAASSFIDGKEQVHPDFKISEFIKVAREITKKPLLFWTYDEINIGWKKLYQSFQQKDLMEFLRISYDLKNSSSPFLPYYSLLWINKLESRKHVLFDPNSFYKYTNEFKEYVIKQKKSQKAERLQEAAYVGESIWSLVEEWESEHGTSIYQKEKYQLADSMIIVYNHLGNVKQSEFYFNICVSLADFVSPEDFCGTVLSVATMFANSFQFDKAIEWSDFNVKRLEKIKQVGPNVFPVSMSPSKTLESRLLLLGKAYSSLGQMYSFNGDSEMAVMYFEAALEEFAGDSGNQEMTISFLLHLALDLKNRELYDKYVIHYLNDRGIMEQFKYLSSLEDVQDHSYKLFLFVKSLNVFQDPLSKSETKEISRFLGELLFVRKSKTVYPWQLIYKHAALWLQGQSKHSLDLKQLKFLIHNTVQDDDQIILKLMNLATELFLSDLYKSSLDNKKQTVETFKEICSLNDGTAGYFNGLFEIESFEDQVNFIQDCFRFTYI